MIYAISCLTKRTYKNTVYQRIGALLLLAIMQEVQIFTSQTAIKERYGCICVFMLVSSRGIL